MYCNSLFRNNVTWHDAKSSPYFWLALHRTIFAKFCGLLRIYELYKLSTTPLPYDINLDHDCKHCRGKGYCWLPPQLLSVVSLMRGLIRPSHYYSSPLGFETFLRPSPSAFGWKMHYLCLILFMEVGQMSRALIWHYEWIDVVLVCGLSWKGAFHTQTQPRKTS